MRAKLGALALVAALGACGPKKDVVAPPPAADLLTPVLGMPAMEDETKRVIAELIDHLPPDQASRVKGVPIEFEQTDEINAYAGCDEKGPFIAGTTGLLDVANGLAQTLAADQLFGLQTHEKYAKQVVDKVMEDKPNLYYDLSNLPPETALDKKRLSRAHEIFDDIVAFTFGHELAHHYLGHTPCAAKTDLERNLARLGDIATRFAPVLNQPAEVAADQAGIQNVLVTGRARATHPLNEGGARMLLTFFDRLEQAAGQGNRSLLKSFLMTHPPSALRLRVLNESVARFQGAPPPH
jgi:hypothetical protein